jgi:hypothetical protein
LSLPVSLHLDPLLGLPLSRVTDRGVSGLSDRLLFGHPSAQRFLERRAGKKGRENGKEGRMEEGKRET